MAVLVLQFIQIRPPDKHLLFLTANLYGEGYFQNSCVFEIIPHFRSLPELNLWILLEQCANNTQYIPKQVRVDMVKFSVSLVILLLILEPFKDK